MTWLPEESAGATALERLLGLCPDLLEDYHAFDRLLRSGPPIDPALLELARLRIAGLHACAPELALRRSERLDEHKRERIAGWRAHAGDFTACEAAVLLLAEKFALEPHGVVDADVATVAAHLSPPELVALLEGLAMTDGFTRFQVVLGAGEASAATPVTGASPGPAAQGEGRRPAARPERAPSSTPRLAAPPPSGTDAISGSVLAHQPELLHAFLRLYGTLWSHGVVDHATKEVLRLRNARVTDCNYCKNVRFAEARRQGLDEATVAQIDDAWEESSLSERHKVALRLADAFLVDPHGLDDRARAALLAHFAPAEIVEMTAGLALFMGFSKITVVLGREPVAMPTTIVPTPTRPA